MEKLLSAFLGIFLVILALMGLGKTNSHRSHARAFGLMNVDKNHSILRIPLAAALLYGSSQASVKDARGILSKVGIFYIGMGTAGLVDKRVGGLLPSGLSRFDIVYHFVVGVKALWMGGRPGRMLKP
jgi:hypothetical protein